MKLILHREDLLLKNVDLNCSQVEFEDFRPEVQRAIRAVKEAGGHVAIYEDDHSDDNVIFLPQET